MLHSSLHLGKIKVDYVTKNEIRLNTVGNKECLGIEINNCVVIFYTKRSRSFNYTPRHPEDFLRQFRDVVQEYNYDNAVKQNSDAMDFIKTALA